MTFFDEFKRNITRRYFLAQGSHAVGWAALATLLGRQVLGAVSETQTSGVAHFASRAEHVIYMHMVGGPPCSSRRCRKTVYHFRIEGRSGDRARGTSSLDDNGQELMNLDEVLNKYRVVP